MKFFFIFLLVSVNTQHLTNDNMYICIHELLRLTNDNMYIYIHELLRLIHTNYSLKMHATIPSSSSSLLTAFVKHGSFLLFFRFSQHYLAWLCGRRRAAQQSGCCCLCSFFGCSRSCRCGGFYRSLRLHDMLHC